MDIKSRPHDIALTPAQRNAPGGPDAPHLASRLLLGALAGVSATTAMTAVMRRLHARLPGVERYPLPPREITERLLPDSSEAALRDESMAAHFGYGAVVGAAIAATGVRPGIGAGAAIGTGVWLASYFGWAPALGILKPANRHPAHRNGLMIAAHLVWGAATTWGLRELADARQTMLSDGPLRDAPSRAG